MCSIELNFWVDVVVDMAMKIFERFPRILEYYW